MQPLRLEITKQFERGIKVLMIKMLKAEVNLL